MKILKKVIKFIFSKIFPNVEFYKVQFLFYPTYSISIIIKGFFSSFNNKTDSLNKNLYVSCVGKDGKENLKKIIEKFGHEHFDYLIIIYDDTKFNEKIFVKCKFVQEVGYKWKLIKNNVPPDLGNKYNYIFLWDDDIGIENFSVLNFLNILNRNNLDCAQPALTPQSYYTYNLTLQDKKSRIGRRTDFVEIMVPVIKGTKWFKFWNMIEKDYNPWGFGYDYYMLSRCQFFRLGIIDSEAITHLKEISKKAGAGKDFERFKKENSHMSYAKVICIGRLK